MNQDAILRIRYAPEAALVAATIEVVALLRMSLLAAHQRLLEELLPVIDNLISNILIFVIGL